ncbi:lysylphosphatidylglycerol synthase domain-containing protein [uncultured Ruegeria sp.]|uniref:lysylphosphatidylglycerol synthase domain-containing protein n=1 Tax=uncultured Ruegeria sp. TaxID=259304 RepID=UPI0026067C4C|nr:lysylphosphatidylglycerol synthase domain-containing protein [uncultured Ruegeria sp.]
MNAESVARARRPLWQRGLLIIAALGFALGVYLSIRARPELISDLNFGPLFILAAVCVPFTVLLNTEEFRLSGLLVGHHFPRISALEITIVASVANMLPIPGGTMVRIGALKTKGANLKDGTAATLLISFLWIGAAFLYSGAWLLVLGGKETGGPKLGPVFCLFGAVLLVIVAALGARMFKQRGTVARLILIKIGLVLTDAARIYLCFLVLGVDATFGQASVLTVSSVVGASVSIVPAGLGIREGTAALLAPLIALGAATGYLSTSLNRVVGLMVLAPVALALSLRKKAVSDVPEI